MLLWLKNVTDLGHSRGKRGLADLFDPILFKLQSPACDWKKIIGSEDIGASFGLIIKNGLDLNIAPLSGHLIVDVHDEVFARVHLGILNINLDIVVIRMCFKGHTEYSFNLLQEFDINSITDLTTKFDNIITKIFDNINRGVSTLQQIIAGDIDFIQMFEDLKDAVEDLPNKVWDIGEAVKFAMRIMGKYAVEDWPVHLQPLVRAVYGVVNKINKIRTDVLTFYDLLTQTVTVDLPWAADQIWESIVVIVENLDDVFTNPKGALADIFKAVFRLQQAVAKILENKRKMENIVYPGGHFPDWFYPRAMVEEARDNLTNGYAATKTATSAWLVQSKKDPIRAYTGIKESKLRKIMETELESVITKLKEPLEPLLTLADQFLTVYNSGMNIINAVKEGYTLLNEQYLKVMGMYQSLFGARAHVKFKRKMNLERGGGCPGGFFPTTHNGKYGDRKGVDLEAAVGDKVYSPFTGTLERISSTAVRINCTGASVAGLTAYVENIQLKSDVFADITAKTAEVTGGQDIGTVVTSGCNNHIHFAIKKGTGYLDPTKFLEPRGIQIPTWVQDCDDYKLVWKLKTIAAGSVVGLAGKQQKDTTPGRTATKPDTSNLKGKMSSRRGRRKRSAINTNAATASKYGFPAVNASGPSSLFNINNLKVGHVLDFLDELGMTESKASLQQVADDLKALLDSKPCERPESMTEAQLRMELQLRGQNSTGSRPILVEKMRKSDVDMCPFLTLSVPSNVYCKFSDLCLGLTCCVDMKMWKFRKSIKAYAVFNITDFTFYMGIETAGVEPFRYQYKVADAFWGIQKEIATPLTIDFTGEDPMNLKMRFMLEYKEPSHFFLTFSVGLCGEKCLDFIHLLKRAPIPVPKRGPNGELVMPELDITAIAQTVVKTAMSDITHMALVALGLPSDLLDGSKTCMFPHRLTVGQLTAELKNRSLPTTGNQNALVQRLKDSDSTCDYGATLPALPTRLNNSVHCKMDHTCLGISCCMMLNIKRLNFTRAFNAWLRLDACNFQFIVGFETLEHRKLLFTYPWGIPQDIKLTEGVYMILTINKTATDFIVDFGVRICEPHECIIEGNFIRHLVVPIPICNKIRFDAASIDRFIQQAGSNMASGLVDLIVENAGLQDIFYPAGYVVALPKRTLPGNCSLAPSFDWLPKGFSCQVNAFCLGIDCIMNMNLMNYTNVASLAYVNLDFCNYTFNIGLGNWSYHLALFTYPWGKVQEKILGEDAFHLHYSIAKNDVKKVFVVNFNVTLCIEGRCSDSNPLMRNMEIPQPFCNTNLSATISNVSVSGLQHYVEQQGYVVGQVLAETSKNALLQILGIDDLVEDRTCPRPVVLQSGWSGLDRCTDMNAPTLPNNMTCTVQSNCLGLTCCMDVNLKLVNITLKASAVLDMCNYTLSLTLGKRVINKVLFVYNWGTREEIPIGDAFKIYYYIKKNDAEKKFLVTVEIALIIDGDVEAVYTLLKDSKIPQLLCDPQATLAFIDGARSVAGYLEALNISEATQVTSTAISGLLSYNGISDVFDLATSYLPPISSVVFMGWIDVPLDACPDVTWPELATGVVCEVTSSTCTGVTCYREFDLSLESFESKTWMDFDPCDYQLTIGLGLKTVRYSVLPSNTWNYTWGEVKTVKFGTVFNMTFAIGKEGDDFVFDFSLRYCQDVGHCTNTTFLKKTKVPQPACYKQDVWTPTSGSVSTAITQMKQAAVMSPVLPGVFVEAADRAMGVVQVFTGATDCTGSTSGWTGANNCPAALLPTLPTGVGCTASDGCYHVTCCMTLDLCSIRQVKPNFHVNFDPCTYILSVGMGTWTSEFNLYQYTWGETETISIGSILSFSYSIQKLDSEDVFQISSSFRLSCGTSTATNIPVMHNTKVPYKTDCGAVDIPDTVDAFLALQGGQVGNAGQDYVMRGLGLADTFAGHSCSHQSSTSGAWHGLDACPSTFQPPTLPSTVDCTLDSLCMGMSCCSDFDLKVGTFRTTAALNFDPCKLTLSARIGGTEFTGLDLYTYTWGTEETLSVGLNDELRLTYTISHDKPAKTYYLSFSVTTCVDTCTTPVVILSHVGIPEPACVQEMPVLPGAGTIQDLVTQYSDSLGDAALQPAYRYWGLPDDFNPQDTCMVPSMSPSCDLDLSTLNLPDTYQYSLHDSCTGIETCVECDLQVQTRSSKVAVSFDPCDMTLTLTLHSLSHTVRLYDFEWEVEQVWEIGSLYQLKYTLWNELEARQYRIDLEVMTCLDPGSCQSCGHVMQNSVFPKPTCDTEASCELDASNPGLSVTAYLNSFGADTTDAVAEEALANIYQCQGIPYMMTESCTAQADNCWWTSSFSNGTDCGADNSCTGITCCHEFDYKIITKRLSVHFDIDPCTYVVSHGIGSQTFTHNFFDFPWGQEQQIRIEKAFFIRYTVADEGTNYRVSYFVAQCRDDMCQNGWDLLSDAFITKRQCTAETCSALQLPGDSSLSGFASEMGGTVNDYVMDAVFCKLNMRDQLGAEECSLQPSGVGPSECSSIALPDVPGLHCEINPGCLGFNCCMEIDLRVKTWSFKMGVTYDPVTYKVEAAVGNRKHDFEPFLYPWGEEQSDTVGPITVKYNVDYPAGGDCNSMKFSMELDVTIDGTREPNMPLTIEATSAHPLVDAPYVLPDTVDSFLTEETRNPLKEQAVFRSLGTSDLFCLDACSHSVQATVPDTCVEQNTTLPSEPGNLTCSYTDQCSSAECCLSVDFKTGRRSFSVWYQVDVNSYELSVGLGSYVFTSSLLLPLNEDKEEPIGDVFRIRYNIESMTEDQQYKANLRVIFNTGDGDEEFILLDNILLPEAALDPDVPFTIEGVSAHPMAFYPLSTQLGGMDVTKTADNAVLQGTTSGTGLNNEDGGSQTLQVTADSPAYVDFPNDGNLESRSSITILAAIRPSTLDQSAPIFDYTGGSVGPDVHGLYLWLSPNGTLSANLKMQTLAGVQDVMFQSEENAVTAGEWNFVGISYDNVTARGYLWVDGEVVGEVRHQPGLLATDTNARAGYAEDADGNSYAFSGNLACVQVWNISLTGQQVGEAMNFCPYSGSFSITAWPETVAKFLQSVHYDPAVTGPITDTMTKAVFRHYDMYNYLQQDECDTASLTATVCPDLSLKQDDTVFLQPADQCLGVHGCIKLDYAVKSYSFDLSFSLDPNTFTVLYSFGGQQFSADLFEVANGEVQTQRISSSIELKWTARPLVFGELISVNLDLHFATDNHLVVHSILKNVSLPNKAIEQSDASTFANVLSKVKNFPASLAEAEYLSFTGSQLGIDAAILRQPSLWEEELTMPTFTAGSNCILKTVAENVAELSNNMVSCVALEHCVGIQCQASVDLKVVQPVFLVSLKINPCLPDVGTTIRFENEQRYLNFSSTYDVSEGPLETLDFGDHIKLQYSVLRGPDQTFVTTLNLLMCVNNICAVNVPILDELSIPRPPYCTRRRRDLQASEEAMTLVKTPKFVPLMIHTLGNGLEVQAKECKHTLHVNYDPKAPECPGLPQMWHHHKKCLPYRNCRGVSCCVHLDADHSDLMSHVSLDTDMCGRHLTIRVGNWSFTETIPKAHKRFSQKAKIGEAVQVFYAAMNPDGQRVVVDFKLHVCDHEADEQHCHKVVILKNAVIPLFACREEKLIGDTARASSLRYKGKAAKRIPDPTTAVQMVEPAGKFKALAAYRKQQEAIKMHHSLVKRSTTATNPVMNMTFLDIRKTLDLNNIDPILAFNLLKSMKELLADLVNEAIDLLLSKSVEDIFSSFDITLRGSFDFPKKTIVFFEYRWNVLVGGLVPMQFGFGADGYYGMDCFVAAKVMTMTLQGGVTPYVGITVWGEMGVGAIMYAKLRLEGDIMQTRFPTVAEIIFSKFPFDIGLTLDVELIPLELRLKALVTVEVSIPLIGTIKETLFEALLWQFTTQTITERILDLSTKEEDESPPQIEPPVGGGSSTGQCVVEQIPGLDYTEPAFEIEVAANDDRSPANLFYSVGTSPGESDVVEKETLGGSVTQIKQDLVYGVPLHFIVHACNTGGQCSQATCSLPTYDNTPTTGKIEVDYFSTSDPTKLSAAVKLHDDSALTGQRWALGYGQGVWGDQIGEWRSFTIKKSTTSSSGLAAFTAPREGRLGVDAFKVMAGKDANNVPYTPERCATECLKYTDVICKSFNFDYDESKTCELLGEIEAVGQKGGAQVQISGRFHFYERLGVGHTAALSLDGLELIHNQLYFFNVEADNSLEYLGQIASRGILADFTPPDPGFAGDVLSDETSYEACHDKVVGKWHQNRCETSTSRLPNHRIIQDGPTSRTISNGMKHQVGGYYTRANTFISISFDGIHDDETGIYGYSWCAGVEYCDCMIHPHHDPHDHLYDSSEWTHTGTIYPIPPAPTVVNGILPDRRYYLSIRAFNNVAHGGTMSLTVCHTSPYGIDNTPPVFHGLTGVEFDIDTNDLQISYNASDEQSAVVEADIGLGLTKFDVLVMNWERHNHTGTIEINPTIEDGVPAWPKIRAVNGVYLMTVGTADVPIVIDGSAPIGGDVFDGSDYGEDLDWTSELNEVCANWKDFYDPESGLKIYWWGVGTTPGETDLMAFESVDTRTHQACANLATPLVHMSKYYTTVVAVHGGYRGMNVSVTSNGSQVDLTPPESGWFVDGNSEETDGNGVPIDLEFTSEPARVDAQWGDFLDPESGVDEFTLSIYRRQLNGDGIYGDDQLMHGPDDIDKSQRAANFFHFHLIHGDVVWSKLTAINVAGGVTEALTDGFIVDLTPPVFDYLVDIWDGDSTTDTDRDFQTNQDSFSSGWGFLDNESGLDHFKMAIFETLHGTKQQIFPDDTWELLYPATLDHHKVSGLSLSAGALYQTRVAAVNRALLSAAYDTDGAIVDPSPPVILYVRVGVLDGSEEEKIDGYVWQADPEGIQASWKALDPESQIKDYWVCIGTSSGSCNVLDYQNMGSEEAGYINGLSLTLTDWNSKTPVYYVTVKARNGANSFSDTTTSTPVFVVDRDKAGYITDGAEEGVDIDYQKDDITLMAHFSGFESQLNGIAHYLWAVGTSSGEDDVQPFLSAGIILKPEDQVRGGGLGGSGKARAILSLACGTAYYVTIRAVTGAGDILESYSDGVTVVCSRPVVDITRIGVDLSGGNTAVAAGETTYRQDKDALSAAWEVSDATCPVTSGWYQFGTVPSGSSIRSPTSYDPSYGNKAAITPVGAGMPNILTVSAENAAGISGFSISSSVIIDETPPDIGTVTCPEYLPGASTEIYCTWAFFLELESRIDRFEVRIGTMEGKDDTMGAVTLEGSRSDYRATGLILDDTHQYYVTVTAYNSVGLKTDAYSGSIVVDASPPVTGVVVELSDLNTVSFSTEASPVSNCTGDECTLAKDALCQKSLTQVTAEWTPFSDPDSSIDKMELAIGSTPGAGDVRKYREVEVNPSGPISIEGLDLTEVSQVFVAVKAYNKAGLTTVAISNGVYISKDSRGLVYDGENAGQDLEYQTSLNTLYASWDFSGDPCPIANYEWAITRVDETVVQDFTDVDVNTWSSNDNLQMTDGETYYVTVKATNIQNITRIERSNGITVQREPLIPGLVRDGPVPGYDLNFQIADDEISANYDGFGVDRSSINAVSSGNPSVEKTEEESAHQAVDYYEIAVGTDRLYKSTRNNIIDFTNVGLNKTWTFFFVENLVPKTGIYYVTVRASSANYAQVEVTSNGIRVGCDGGVTAGDVTVPAFINSPSKVLVEWSNFETEAEGIHLNFVGIGHKTDNTTAYQDVHALHCKDMMDTNSEVYASLNTDFFTTLDWTVVDKDTFYKAEGLDFQHDEDYFATVVAMDVTGECNKTTATFHVDLTDPIEGRLRAGPLYDMVMTYVDSSETFAVNWEDYLDPESGIASYELALFKAASCAVEDEDSLSVEVDWIRLNNSYRSYAFVELELRTNIPYYVHLRVTNNAGSSILTVSAPIIYDLSKISIGSLVDGHNYTEDLEYHGDNTILPGMFLHLADPGAEECPRTPSPFTDGTWQEVTTDKLWGMCQDTSNCWNATFRAKQVKISENGDDIKITMIRDVQKPQLYTGAIYRPADMQKGGTYQVDIRAASGIAVTNVLFYTGPDGTVGDFNYCMDCCLSDSDSKYCPTCTCSRYTVVEEPEPETQDTSTAASDAPPFAVIPDPVSGETYEGDENERFVTQSACGMQIHPSGTSNSKLILWCRYHNDVYNPTYKDVYLNFDPSRQWYTYKFVFKRTTWESLEDWSLELYIDDQMWAMISGLPAFNDTTKLMFSMWNKDNQVPELEDKFNPFETYAYFRRVILPPPSDVLCRYGRPWRGNTAPIIKYYGGVMSEDVNGTAYQVVDFREIYDPCIACLDGCSRFACDPTCDGQASENIEVKFNLTDLALPTTRTVTDEDGEEETYAIPYKLIVRALSAKGQTVNTTSNGFYIDMTPPTLESSFHFDKAQGDKPTSYQQSNDTIKAYWRFTDSDSGIKEIFWAIFDNDGTQLQDYESVGINQTAENSTLAGRLLNNHTCYVALKAVNKAGLIGTGTTSGVTVQLLPPDIDIETTALGTAEFDTPTTPVAKKSSNGKECGVSFQKPTDEGINKTLVGIKLCGEDGEFTVPYIQVATNGAGTVAIRDGHLYISDVVVANVSALPKPIDLACFVEAETKPSTSDVEAQKSASSYMEANPNAKDSVSQCSSSTPSASGTNYNIPPGSCTMNCVKMCYPSNLCTESCNGPIITLADGDEAVTAEPGQPLSASSADLRRRRKRSTPDDYDLTITAMGEVSPGVTLAFGMLDDARIAEEYGSDASDDFIPYITDPALTIEANMTSRYLLGRIKTIMNPSFYLTTVGQVELNDSLAITTTFDPSANWTELTQLLIFWNKDLDEWDDASRTCNEHGQTEVDEVAGTLTTYVCSTNYPTRRSQRTRRSTDSSVHYFSRETQFAVVIALKGIPNEPPEFTSTLQVWMEEDSGTLMYWIESDDADGDDLIYGIVPGEVAQFGTISLSEDGLLQYKNFKEEWGFDNLTIFIRENRTDDDIIPALETQALLSIEVIFVNDWPEFSVEIDGQMRLVTENNTLEVTVEQNIETNIYYQPYQIVVTVWDPDNYDTLQVEQYNATFGTAYVQLLEPDPAEIPAEGTFIKAQVTYVPIENFYGHDEFILIGIDAAGAYSERLIFDMHILNMPCVNNATCRGIEDDWNCTHTKRADGYDGYECECLPGWVGRYCETDFDECVSSPCPWPKECHDGLDHYWCQCPDSNPNCEVLPPWAIALIALSIAGSIVAGISYYRYRELKKRYHIKKLNKTLEDEPDQTKPKETFIKKERLPSEGILGPMAVLGEDAVKKPAPRPPAPQGPTGFSKADAATKRLQPAAAMEPMRRSPLSFNPRRNSIGVVEGSGTFLSVPSSDVPRRASDSSVIEKVPEETAFAPTPEPARIPTPVTPTNVELITDELAEKRQMALQHAKQRFARPAIGDGNAAEGPNRFAQTDAAIARLPRGPGHKRRDPSMWE
ncbi:uncharacterized protein LOC118406510 [Branchiostoma floridae]|uniref:Uncharacterized protein LOC118406510 n=1 Tax=Branchiostoma floridae TaxID=7739 RepID=A0A9J7KGV4_BRAFL|nr:uncharacterized protein LOC118406510 [Branchiostoma floridae]